MKFDQLQYFVETARRQHIGQAAKFLHISPSAISHSISSLESELGKKLFEKTGRSIVLTQHGKALFERASELLGDAQRLKEDLSSDHIEMRGHYRIAATPILCSHFVTPVWMDVQDRSKLLTATIHSLRSADVLAKVNSGEADIGICFSPHSGPNHDEEVIFKGPLALCFSRKHPFLQKKIIAELNEYPSIAPLASQGIENCEAHPELQKFGIKPRVTNLYDSYDVAIEAIKRNNLWGLVPDVIAQLHRKDIEMFTPKGWKADYKICAIWPKHRIRTHTLDILTDGIRARIKSIFK